MKPRWMEKDEAESGYGPTAVTLLKNLLMGVGIGGALEYLLRKRKKNKESFTVQDERNLKELEKQQKAAKKGSSDTRGMDLKSALKTAKAASKKIK